MADLTPEESQKQVDVFNELITKTRRAMQFPTTSELPGGLSSVSGPLVGEAGMEVQELIAAIKSDENRRWAVVCKNYPYGVCFVDPGESFREDSKANIPIYEKYAHESRSWLAEIFGSRDGEFYEEVCNRGLYRIRFVKESDLLLYKARFETELVALRATTKGPLS